LHHLLRLSVVAGMLFWASMAQAQSTVLLPDTSQTTTVSVSVSEQARVTVPSTVAFIVTNVGSPTVATEVAVTVDQIVLSTASKQLRLSLRANAPSFTPPISGDVTWSAEDLSWTAAAWTSAAGSAGTLSSSTDNTIATCDAGATACSTSALVFTLAGKPTVQRSGAHTLVVTWKVESIGS